MPTLLVVGLVLAAFLTQSGEGNRKKAEADIETAVRRGVQPEDLWTRVQDYLSQYGQSPEARWFAADTMVAQGWSATWNQAPGSAEVTATSMSWNANLAPNASTGIGFNATFSGTSNPPPTAFTLNGNTCTIA